MKYKAIIFDLDGTLLNTLEDLTISMNYALSINGHKNRTLNEVRMFVGNGIFTLCLKACDNNEKIVNKVYEDFTSYYKKHSMDKTRPYVGIKKLVSQLKKDGYELAVVSNKADFVAKDVVKHYFKDLFSLVYGESQSLAKKPSKDMLIAAMRDLNVNSDETLYIGDSEVDIEFAKNANVKCLSVSYGFRDIETLEKYKAYKIVNEVKQLYKAINDF